VPSLSLPVAFRPVRVGFLVRRGSAADLRLAIALNTAAWGGAFNPIIPVDSVGPSPWVPHLIRLFAVDVLVAVDPAPELVAVEEAHPHLRWPHYGGLQALVQRGNGGEAVLGIVDIRLPLAHFWWREFRHAEKPTGVLPSWGAADANALAYAAMFGCFDESSDIPDLRTEFVRYTNAVPVDIPGHLEAMTSDRRTPLDATALGLDVPTRYTDRPGLVVGDPGNVDHLTLFWNMRASGEDVVFCPVDGPGALDALLRTHIADLVARSRLGSGPDGRPFVEMHVCLRFGATFDDGLHRPELPDSIRALLPDEATAVIGVVAEWDPPHPAVRCHHADL
jgi:hypothetical protein